MIKNKVNILFLYLKINLVNCNRLMVVKKFKVNNSKCINFYYKIEMFKLRRF